MEDGFDIIADLETLHATQACEGNVLSVSEFYAAVKAELEELSQVPPEDLLARDMEYGDFLANALRLGLALGIKDPLGCAKKSADKVRRRLAYIRKRISVDQGHPGYMDEFNRLWGEAKKEEQ